MRKIVAGAMVSLDGVMQAPGGPEEDPSGGFKYGGWIAPLFDDKFGAALDEQFRQPFDLLLGRRTYDIFAAYWPHMQTDPAASDFDPFNANIAQTFDRATKYVATHSPETLSWQNSEALGGDVIARLRQLKNEDGPLLLTQGSTELLQQLLAADLVDELRLVISPVILGKGKRLFGAGTIPAGLKLIKSDVTSTGVILATYERAGDVKTGSFAMEQPTEAEIERRKKLK